MLWGTPSVSPSWDSRDPPAPFPLLYSPLHFQLLSLATVWVSAPAGKDPADAQLALFHCVETFLSLVGFTKAHLYRVKNVGPHLGLRVLSTPGWAQDHTGSGSARGCRHCSSMCHLAVFPHPHTLVIPSPRTAHPLLAMEKGARTEPFIEPTPPNGEHLLQGRFYTRPCHPSNLLSGLRSPLPTHTTSRRGTLL